MTPVTPSTTSVVRTAAAIATIQRMLRTDLLDTPFGALLVSFAITGSRS
jgi:hypothetical protein